MEDPEQALAYHRADFSAPHGRRVEIFRRVFPEFETGGPVLDLGCGSGDVLLRFARALPRASFTGVDGSRAMLELAAAELERDAGLRRRVRLHHAVFPSADLPPEHWQLVMSHSLLHQLHRPEVLWQTVRDVARADCRVFVADLRRPATAEDAQRIVDEQAAGEPEVLRRDFYNSLRAAFEPAEVRAQLATAGLAQLTVEPEGEQHLIVYGRI